MEGGTFGQDEICTARELCLEFGVWRKKAKEKDEIGYGELYALLIERKCTLLDFRWVHMFLSSFLIGRLQLHT